MEELLRLLLVRPAESVEPDEAEVNSIEIGTDSDFSRDLRRLRSSGDRQAKARAFVGSDDYVSDIGEIPHGRAIVELLGDLTRGSERVPPLDPGDSLKLRVARRLHGLVQQPKPTTDKQADAILDAVLEGAGAAERRLKDSVLALRESSAAPSAADMEELTDLLKGLHLLAKLRGEGSAITVQGAAAATFVVSRQAAEEERPDIDHEEEAEDDEERPEVRLEQVGRALEDLRSIASTSLTTKKVERVVHLDKLPEAGPANLRREPGIPNFSTRVDLEEQKFISDTRLKALPGDTQAVLASLSINPEVQTFDEIVTEVKTEQKMLFQRIGGKSSALRVVNGMKFLSPLALEAGFFDLLDKIPTPFLPAPLKPLRQITPAGIGDLLVVRQHLKRYQGGDLAHVENVLQGEFKDREHRRRRQTEEIVTTETEKETSDERETQTTSRFELRNEVQEQVRQDTSFEAGVKVNAKYGPFVEVEANAEFSQKNSKQESRQRATSMTQEVVERAATKVTERVREERTRKLVEEVEEINRHGIDAKSAAGHIVGMYQWLNKVYQAQVYNYGLRVMYDIMIPEPAAYYIFATAKNADEAAPDLVPPPDFTLRPSNVNEHNYHIYAAIFEAENVTPPPDEFVTIEIDKQGGPSDEKTVFHATDSVAIPSGYRYYRHYSRSYRTWKSSDTTNELHYSVGDLYGDPGTIPIRISGYDITGFSLFVHIECRRTGRAYEEWRQKTWDALHQAHRAQVAEYEERLAQTQIRQGIQVEGRNPLSNRKLERTELKKHAITLLTGFAPMWLDGVLETPAGPVIKQSSVDQSRYVRFFEQAFEWENMSYVFYPYFWARAKQWRNLLGIEFANDPEFEDFLTAGYARVVVPVRPGFEPAVEHFRQTGQIWSGGKLPTITDPDYLPIVEELKARLQAPGDEVPVGEPWEVVLPTQLVKLRQTPTLPRWEQDADGNWLEVEAS